MRDVDWIMILLYDLKSQSPRHYHLVFAIWFPFIQNAITL